jgi:hypothetical protein
MQPSFDQTFRGINMNIKLTALQLCLLSSSLQAAEIITAPNAPEYTVVTVDASKLKNMTIAQALKAWPGNECTTVSDINSPILCPGLWLKGINSLYFGIKPEFYSPKITTVDKRGRVRISSPDIDGVRQKYWLNAQYLVNRPSIICPDGVTGIQTPEPEPTPLEVIGKEVIVNNVPKKLTEFGFEFDNSYGTPLTEIEVQVNGVSIGTFSPEASGIQYVGVNAPEGITSLKFLPRDSLRGTTYGCGDSLTHEYGYIRGNRFFYQYQ